MVDLDGATIGTWFSKLKLFQTILIRINLFLGIAHRSLKLILKSHSVFGLQVG